MKWLKTKDGIEHIEDNNHLITAQKTPNGSWRRTFPPNQYYLAPTKNQSLSASVVEESDLIPERLPIATRPIYNGDFSQVHAFIKTHGLLPVIRSLTPVENAHLAHTLIASGDLITALTVKEETARFVFGSPTYTTTPEVEMREFDLIANS